MLVSNFRNFESCKTVAKSKVTQSQNCKVSKFQLLEIKVSKFHVSKNETSRCVGHIIPTCSNSAILNVPKLIRFETILDLSCIMWSVLVSPNRNKWFQGSHISKSKSYKLKLKRNHTTELSSISVQ